MTQIGAVPSMTAEEATSVSASAYSTASRLRDATRVSSRSVGAPRHRRALEAASKNASLTRPRSVTPGWATRAHSVAAPGTDSARAAATRRPSSRAAAGSSPASAAMSLRSSRLSARRDLALIGQNSSVGSCVTPAGRGGRGWEVWRRGCRDLDGIGPEPEHSSARGLPELLLEEGTVHDDRLGVGTAHGVVDLVHRRAEQVQLVDEQHDRALAPGDGAAVGPVARQAQVVADGDRQVVGGGRHDAEPLGTADAEGGQAWEGLAHDAGHAQQAGEDDAGHLA